jgi:hypothetical protein
MTPSSLRPRKRSRRLAERVRRHQVRPSGSLGDLSLSEHHRPRKLERFSIAAAESVLLEPILDHAPDDILRQPWQRRTAKYQALLAAEAIVATATRRSPRANRSLARPWRPALGPPFAVTTGQRHCERLLRKLSTIFMHRFRTAPRTSTCNIWGSKRHLTEPRMSL